MSKARDEYYNQNKGICKDLSAERYITELETENEKLVEDITNIGIENINFKQEKAELIELLADINRRIKCGSFNIPMYEAYYMTDVENILNKYKEEK